MPGPVTDPALLAELEKPATRVVDPALLAELEGGPASEMSAPEAGLHGSVEAIPFGQKAVAGASSLGLKLIQALNPDADWAQNMDTSFAGQLGKERGSLEKAEKDQKWATRGGKGLGAALSLALAPAKVAQGAGLAPRLAAGAGNMGLYGFAHGVGAGDTVDEQMSKGTEEGLTSAALGGAGALVGEAVAPVAKYVGGKAKDVAGWLKVNSLHPNPVVAEEMAAIPGGKAGIGRVLLERNIGGMTKAGTSKQIDAALAEQAPRIGEAARALDQATGQPIVDISSKLDRVGKTVLGNLKANQYVDDATQALADKAMNGPLSFEESVALRRALDDEARGVAGSGDPNANRIRAAANALRQLLNREIKSNADQVSPELAGEFKAANLDYRRLAPAAEAAERSAGRSAGNHLLNPLHFLPHAAGLGVGMGHGAAGGLEAAVATKLAMNYGPQAGARLLHMLGSGLEMAPEITAASPAIAPAAAEEYALGRYRALLEAMRRKNQPEEQLAARIPWRDE